MSGPFDQARERLRSIVTVARLDPWTAALVSDLAATGLLDGQLRKGRASDLVTCGKVRYEQWAAAHPDHPDARVAQQALTQVISEVRAWKSVGGPQLQAALDWAGQALLERLDEHSRPLTAGLVNALTGGVWPGDPAASARDASTWWVARSSAPR